MAILEEVIFMQGRLLRVNLSTRKTQVEEIPEQYLRDFLGGSGLAAKYLYDEIPAGSEVLGAENKLFFSIGPLNGGYFPTSGCYKKVYPALFAMDLFPGSVARNGQLPAANLF
jgi:aldehyde:ferredoxin oxidoreductase